MTFAADRPDNVISLKAARLKKGPADSLRDEPKLHELEQERRERLDSGDRTVAAMRFDGLGADMGVSEADLIDVSDRIDKAWEAWKLERAPLTEGEARQKVARHVDKARAELMEALKAADHPELEGLHPRVALVALEADKLQSDLTDEGSAA